MTQKCNGDCFNCIYDDCIIDYAHATSIRLKDKKEREQNNVNTKIEKPQVQKKIVKKTKIKKKREKLKGGFNPEYIFTPLPKLWSEVEFD